MLMTVITLADPRNSLQELLLFLSAVSEVSNYKTNKYENSKSLGLNMDSPRKIQIVGSQEQGGNA